MKRPSNFNLINCMNVYVGEGSLRCRNEWLRNKTYLLELMVWGCYTWFCLAPPQCLRIPLLTFIINRRSMKHRIDFLKGVHPRKCSSLLIQLNGIRPISSIEYCSSISFSLVSVWMNDFKLGNCSNLKFVSRIVLSKSMPQNKRMVRYKEQNNEK